jgi:hypothetical protein
MILLRFQRFGGRLEEESYLVARVVEAAAHHVTGAEARAVVPHL